MIYKLMNKIIFRTNNKEVKIQNPLLLGWLQEYGTYLYAKKKYIIVSYVHTAIQPMCVYVCNGFV